MRKNLKTEQRSLALSVIQLAEELPPGRTTNVISRQLVRSATSIGANYRAACRGKSNAGVISKLSIVEEEADESVYWLELLIESDNVPEERVRKLLNESNEIVAMTVASIKTLRRRP